MVLKKNSLRNLPCGNEGVRVSGALKGGQENGQVVRTLGATLIEGVVMMSGAACWRSGEDVRSSVL